MHRGDALGFAALLVLFAFFFVAHGRRAPPIYVCREPMEGPYLGVRYRPLKDQDEGMFMDGTSNFTLTKAFENVYVGKPPCVSLDL